MNRPTSENDRFLTLLADQATMGVDAREAAELAALLDGSPEGTDDAMELAAAAADVAMLMGSGGMSGLEPMPASLVASISTEARRFTSGANAEATAAPALALARTTYDAPLAPRMSAPVQGRAASGTGAGVGAWMGWLAAAACLAVAASVWLARPGSTPTGTPIARTGEKSIIIDSVVARVDTLKIDWKPLPDATCKEQCAGRVIWNNELQQGWMVFKGLAVNDPGQFQYQLWIFDKEQKHPVDGGVFDIAQARINAAGEVEVPIKAAIKVTDPQAFAVTVEKPGGVVVSDQTRIAVLAPVSKG
ncbi:MAG: anti-sigma factor domain-containing protein [Phycisphaerales bacterium]